MGARGALCSTARSTVRPEVLRSAKDTRARSEGRYGLCYAPFSQAPTETNREETMEGAEVDVANFAGNSEVDALVASTICAHTVPSQARPGEPPRSSPPHPATDNRFCGCGHGRPMRRNRTEAFLMVSSICIQNSIVSSA